MIYLKLKNLAKKKCNKKNKYLFMIIATSDNKINFLVFSYCKYYI